MRRSLLATTAAVAFLVVVPAAVTATSPAVTATPGESAHIGTDAHGTERASPPAETNGTETTNHDDCAPVAGETRENPPGDRLGWEDGCWYDDAIDVTRSDGLNDTELAAVVARSMARVERVRGLEFGTRTPVEVVSREAFAERTADRFANVSAAARLHQNVKYEALFMVGESTDALAAQQRNTASGTLGFYSPAGDRIVIVSENTTAPKMNEITLAQELFHSLQYHRFDPGSWNWSTRERHNANDGIIEGDGNYVDHLYGQRCDDNWSCLEPLSRPDAGDRHVGLLSLTLQPYSDGPVFVREIRRDEGWDGVDAVYERPPESTEQVIHPEKYRSDSPTEVTVTHTASDGWRVLDVPGGVNYAEFGEAGMYAMLWYPAFETRNAPERREVIPLTDWLVRGADLDLYNYDHPYSAGWDGDRLYPYVNGTANRTGETGYVWKSAWDSPAEAEGFARGYRELLDEFGADEVKGHANTYRIDGGTGFDDAFYVDRTGDTVVIVNAPSVSALSDVRRGAAPESTPTPTSTPTQTQTPAPATATPGTASPATATGDPSPPADDATATTAPGGPTPTPTPAAGGTTASTSGPGLGVTASLLAVAAGAVVGALVRRARAG